MTMKGKNKTFLRQSDEQAPKPLAEVDRRIVNYSLSRSKYREVKVGEDTGVNPVSSRVRIFIARKLGRCPLCMRLSIVASVGLL
jgi:hypothetical protein